MSSTAKHLFGVFAGNVNDGGFIESGYRGALASCRRFGLEFRLAERVEVDAAALVSAIDAGAAGHPDLMLVHGGRSDEAVAIAAPNHPGIRFLSTHGAVAGENFSCFTIAQPESAFLAGALAGRLTQSGVVGHLSGIRIAPGLRSRAAYAQGVRHTNSQARLVTCFCGTQEDNAITYRAALAEIDAGVDILYTMLNSGRRGAIDACRERGVRQIGNVRDWTLAEPDVFIASAIADTGRLVEAWVDDVMHGRLTHGELRRLGLEDPLAVSLAMAPDVPASIRAEIDSLSAQIESGLLCITDQYQGPEFTVP
jgi:basic membrane protein A